jgi:hypothetical protein
LVAISLASWIAGLFVVMVLGLYTMNRPTPIWIGISYLAVTTIAATISCWAFLECPKGSMFSKIMTGMSALVAVLLALIVWGSVF